MKDYMTSLDSVTKVHAAKQRLEVDLRDITVSSNFLAKLLLARVDIIQSLDGREACSPDGLIDLERALSVLCRVYDAWRIPGGRC